MQFGAAAQIPIDIGPINCEEFAAVCIIREERLKKEAEEFKKQ